jgi:8-oxo-dGTP diphosphatase/2-hydroxy-dATP diphosphatase
MTTHTTPLRNSTLVFLVKKSGRDITDVCLAMKKRGFGVGRWNGVGGKVTGRESITDAAIRETQEEIGVSVNTLHKVAELEFTFTENASWNQLVHVYIATEWGGDPAESEEMKPEWYAIKAIPYTHMWPDDIFWLPKILKGELVQGSFTFGAGDEIKKQKIQNVSSTDFATV